MPPYSRSELLQIQPSPLDPSVAHSIRSCGIGFHLPKQRTHRAGRRKQRNIPTVSLCDRHKSCTTQSRNQSVSREGDCRRTCNQSNLINIPLTSTPNENFRVALFNARSVNDPLKRAEISTFIVDNNIDIFFITETWLKPRGDEAKCSDLAPVGYTVSSFPRSSRGGGVAVVYRNKLVKCLSAVSTFPFEHSSYEACRVTLALPTPTHFICVYRPPPSRKNKLTDSLFLGEFANLLDFSNSLAGRCIIVGDVNVHYDSQDKPSTLRLKQSLDVFRFSQAVDEPTHERGHILDWIIYRPDDQCLSSASVTQSLSSDHYCVVCNLSLSVSSSDLKVHRQSRNIRGIDRAAFLSDLRDTISPQSCPTVDKFNSSLASVLDKHAPLCTKRTRADKNEPWYHQISTELKAAKIQKRRAEKTWLSNPITINKQIFNQAKKRLAKIVFSAKSKFYKNKLETATSSKQLFSTSNKLLGRDSISPLPNTHPVTDLPEVFNDYFVEKVQLIRNDLDKALSSLPADSSHPKQASASGFESFVSITDQELRKEILRAKPTSCLLDPLPTPLFIEFLDELLPTLTAIINSSLASGSFPSVFKSAVVKPLLKKSTLDPNILKNYRPVSNLSFLSKITEKIVLKQLLIYLNKHQLISPSQSAYRPHHSTETALLRVINDILLALDSGDVSILTLLDLSAAFDTIDHQVLLNRLQFTYGITGSALSWFSSYLQDRTQSVSINDNLSKQIPLTCGVPQGSVLGPVLFILYTKPLSDLISRHAAQSQSFADDTQLYASAPPSAISSPISSIESCILEIKSWMLRNKLKLNDDKTEVLFLHSTSKQYFNKPSSISVCGNQIQFSPSARNLGFYVSENMSVDLQVSNICRAAYYELRRISTIRHLLSVDTTKTFVCAFVLSKIDYCNSLLFGCSKQNLNKLQKVQNSAARLVLRVSKYDHATPLLKTLHWLPIQARIEYKLSMLCHSFFSGTAPQYLSDLLSVYTPPRQLRSSSDMKTLCVPSTRTKSFGQRSFSFAAPTSWNALPYAIRHVQSKASFKKALKTHLFKTYYSV